MIKKTHWIALVSILVIIVLALTACGLEGEGPQTPPDGGDDGQGETGSELPTKAPPEEQPTEAPPELAPTEAPPEPAPTEAPAEPAATPFPAQPPVESGEETVSNEDLLKILIVLVIILLIVGVIMIIVAALRGGKSEAQPVGQETAPMTVDDHLNTATPRAVELYRRFAELVQTFGAVSVVPTQTRIDFQARIIFASVEFREDSLLVNLVLPQRLESPRIIRVDTYTQSSFANYLYIHTLDDYDAAFSAWLQEAYNLGVRGI